MADENKIQLEVELSQSSIDKSFRIIDDRSAKSAETSAQVFEQHFKQQEEDLKNAIDRIVGSTRKVAEKSAKASADVFAEMFKKQESIYAASVKQNLDNAINSITGGDRITKSARESASVFEEAFNKQIKKADPVKVPLEVPNTPFAVRGLADLAGGFFLLKQAADVAQRAISFTIDTIIQGENEIKLEKKFEILSTQAGIFSDTLKNDMKAAVRGLVDDSRLFDVASQAFIQIGANAQNLPKILDLANRSYKVFGGDIVSNTELINNAIFTGQTRQLRQIGLLIDSNKVYKEYANSIGTVVPLLSEQQRQQALLNEILRQGNERFKSIATDTNTTSDSFTRAKVALTELNDEMSKAVSSNAGSFFKGLADVSARVFGGLADQIKQARPAETVDEIVERVQILRKRIEESKTQLESLGEGGGSTFFDSLRLSISTAEEELSKYVGRLDQLQMEQAKTLAQGDQASPADSSIDDERLRRREQFLERVRQINDQVKQSDLEVFQQQFQNNQNENTLREVMNQQKVVAEAQFLQELSAVKKQYDDLGIQDQELYNEAAAGLQEQFRNKLKTIDSKWAMEKKALEDKANKVAFEGTRGALDQIATLQQNATGELAEIGKAAAVTKATMDGYVAVQNALAQVPYPFNFAAAALVGAAAAANVAKIMGIGGGGGSASFNPDSGSGGSSPWDTPLTQAPSPQDIEPATPSTTVALTINGNVLDRRETGLELAQILEEQFSEQGLTVRGAV